MGGWGRQNPWPLQWGGGKSEFERLWEALRGALGEGGPGPVGGIEDAWRESVVAGIVGVTTMPERAMLQALPLWATDHLPVYERLLGLSGAGSDQQRREAAWRAWISATSAVNEKLLGELRQVDENISIVNTDDDEVAAWTFGVAFEDGYNDWFADPLKGTNWPAYSERCILRVLWEGCEDGIPPADELAEVEKILQKALPAWWDYTIVTGQTFYLDGYNDSRLDVTALG